MGKIRKLSYVVFGLIVFALTTLFLNMKSNVRGEAGYFTINDEDGYVLDYPDVLRRSNDGMVLLYVETKPCAKCSETLILNMVKSIKEAGLSVEPIMVYHLEEGFNKDVINDYNDCFADHIDLIVSPEDSIRIRNPWIPQGLGFYGIVTDSLNIVQYAGSLFDKAFMACCSRQFGKETEWD